MREREQKRESLRVRFGLVGLIGKKLWLTAAISVIAITSIFYNVWVWLQQ